MTDMCSSYVAMGLYPHRRPSNGLLAQELPLP